MKSLAELIVRGRWTAVLVIAVAGILTYLYVPFTTVFGYMAAAAVALVTLHIGVVSGLQVLLLASAATLLCYQALGLVMEQGGVHAIQVMSLLTVLLLWLPCWLLAAVLRQTRSLGHALLAAVAFGACLLLAAYGYFDDPAQWWDQRLQDFGKALQEVGVTFGWLDDGALRARIAALLTGAVVASQITGVTGSLLLARWWQSQLVRPGAFREEFCRLRLGSMAGLLTLAMLVLARVVPGTGGALGAQLAMIMLVPYLLIGLAVLHSLLQQVRWGAGMLVGVYLALVFVPQASLVLATGGLLDTWIDFRRRLRRGATGSN